jgi:hypothetical protein
MVSKYIIILEFDDIEDNDNKEDFFDHGEFTLRRLAG